MDSREHRGRRKRAGPSGVHQRSPHPPLRPGAPAPLHRELPSSTPAAARRADRRLRLAAVPRRPRSPAADQYRHRLAGYHLPVMRRFVLFLLCLAIALQAWAGTQSRAEPCPMAADMVAMASAPGATASESGALGDDCCNDAATFAKTGQPCKTGQDCQAPALWAVPVTPWAAPVAPPPALRAVAVCAAPRGLAALVWRPPTLR